ncbi:arylsulfatase [candidate division KSB1 bacterium]|nr:MAG: arylsulfatase [candidate division KSB1 bacterium]
MENQTRRKFLKAVSSTVLSVGSLSLLSSINNIQCSSNKSNIPNIVFIMADDMGYGDAGCYNSDSMIPTPNIDRLAEEGVRFTDAHTPAALCTPTRYGLLTGRYCWRTRLKRGVLLGYDETSLIEPERTTIADLLKNKGYNTACIGKWHLGLNWPTKSGYKLKDDGNKWKEPVFKENEEHIDFTRPIGGGPIELGFDYFFGTAGCSTSDPPYCFIENNRTVSIPVRMSPKKYDKLPGFVRGLMADDWSEEDVDPVFTKKSIKFIENHLQKDPDNPFFLYLALSSPHIPWLVPDFIKGKSQEGPRGDLVVLVDWCVGQILDTLDKYNLAENTLIIFTSDNGPRKGANGHKSAGEFRGYKAQIWEGGHRVPFIARWPGKIKLATMCDELISLTDMFATFAAIVGARLRKNEAEDSFNILPALLGKSVPNSTSQARIFHSGGGVFAIRQGKWKLIQGTKGPGSRPLKIDKDLLNSVGQLYDMENDPYEKNDLWDKHPDVVKKLLRLLEKCKKQGYSRDL